MNRTCNKIGISGSLLFIVLNAMLLSSCVYDKEFAYINDQIMDLNRRVAKIQKSVDRQLVKDRRDLDGKLATIRATQAEQGADMERLRGEINELSGRTEDNERVVRRAVERDLGELDELQTALTRLSEKTDELEAVVRYQQDYLGIEMLKPGKEGDQGTEGEQERALSGAPESQKLNEDELYNKAMALFKDSKFEEAMDIFKAFLSDYPKSDRADNAQFWIGECLTSLKQHEKAILAYEEVIKKYPKGNKVPAAMLKQALGFLGIKDKTSARLLLKRIIKKYPNSNETKIAKKKIKTIK